MSTDVFSHADAPPRRTSAKGVTSRPAEKPAAQSAAGWKRRSIGLAAIAVLGTAASLMFGGVASNESTSRLTHTLRRGELLVTVTEDGTLESSRNKEIKCQVKGGSTILWIIEDGSEVKPGDELVRLDASTIEDTVGQQKIAYQTARAAKIQAESDLAVASINVTEYLEGTFRKEMQTAQSNIAIAEENLRVAQNTLEYTEKMFRRGYVGKLELDSNQYAVQYAELELALRNTEVDVLDRFTKPKKLQELDSAHKAAQAKLESAEAALQLEEERLKRLEQQRDACVVHAESSGIVIYPATEEWRNEPAIEEGSAVHEQQTLLQIPDLLEMQVKVGIHESKVRKLKTGLPARVKIQDAWHAGEVVSIATQVSPSGWWDGNMRKFETVVRLKGQPDVRPGMSAEVEIVVAKYQDVLTIPVAAVLEQHGHFHAWVETDEGPEKRTLKLGESNDQFIVVETGVREGERVVLSPLDSVDEAQSSALNPLDADEPDPQGQDSQPPEPAASQPASSDANQRT
jgi:HlyD family secretion protein